MKTILPGIVAVTFSLSAFAADEEDKVFSRYQPACPSEQDASLQNGTPETSATGQLISSLFSWPSWGFRGEEADPTQQPSSLLTSLKSVVDSPSSLLPQGSEYSQDQAAPQVTLDEIPEKGPQKGKIYLGKNAENFLTCTAVICLDKEGSQEDIPISLVLSYATSQELSLDILEVYDITKAFQQKLEYCKKNGTLEKYAYQSKQERQDLSLENWQIIDKPSEARKQTYEFRLFKDLPYNEVPPPGIIYIEKITSQLMFYAALHAREFNLKSPLDPFFIPVLKITEAIAGGGVLKILNGTLNIDVENDQLKSKDLKGIGPTILEMLKLGGLIPLNDEEIYDLCYFDDMPEEGPLGGKVYLQEKDKGNLRGTAVVFLEQEWFKNVLPISIDLPITIEGALDIEVLQPLKTDISIAFLKEFWILKKRGMEALKAHIYQVNAAGKLQEQEKGSLNSELLSQTSPLPGSGWGWGASLPGWSWLGQAPRLGESLSEPTPLEKEFITNVSLEDPLSDAAPGTPQKGRWGIWGMTTGFLQGYRSQPQDSKPEEPPIELTNQKPKKEKRGGYSFHFIEDLPANGMPEQNIIYVNKWHGNRLEFKVAIPSEESNLGAPLHGAFEKIATSNPLFFHLAFKDTYLGKIFYGVLNIIIENSELTREELESKRLQILEALRSEKIISVNEPEGADPCSDASEEERAEEEVFENSQKQDAPSILEDGLSMRPSLSASLHTVASASLQSAASYLSPGFPQWFRGSSKEEEVTLEKIPAGGLVAGKVYVEQIEKEGLKCTGLIQVNKNGNQQMLPVSLEIPVVVQDFTLLQSIEPDILAAFKFKCEELQKDGLLENYIYQS